MEPFHATSARNGLSVLKEYATSLRDLHDCNFDSTMHMIGHHHKGVQFYKWEMIGNPAPKLMGDLSNFRQFHFLISNRTKKPLPFMVADGHKIVAFIGIIPPHSTRRGDAVFVLECFHDLYF
ncbi:hypothetical protein QUH73_11060 [Labilibaculum sp. K2S]|uniref:hypothetical protein n=1 Tax=Labilibaculum sp. K2S TaxID=3056386 RepID=UPI0025A37376|nr:hypothetical protein [Labilibaculum sp. K2S]MDM8160353.1 hypothetical protein [Labilibaculum sp. K2S]